jgi:hypothetical protein
MKRFLILILAILIIGCVTPPPPIDPVCPSEGSWICHKSLEMGVVPEHVYGWVYDAVVIASITNLLEQWDVCDFVKNVGAWYDQNYPISYTGLINETVLRINLTDNPEKVALLTGILNRRLAFYRNTMIISKADDAILRKGYDAFISDMGCK